MYCTVVFLFFLYNVSATAAIHAPWSIERSLRLLFFSTSISCMAFFYFMFIFHVSSLTQHAMCAWSVSTSWLRGCKLLRQSTTTNHFSIIYTFRHIKKQNSVQESPSEKTEHPRSFVLFISTFDRAKTTRKLLRHFPGGYESTSYKPPALHTQIIITLVGHSLGMRDPGWSDSPTYMILEYVYCVYRTVKTGIRKRW